MSNEFHINRSVAALISGRRILVVGANTGEDCLRFIDAGAGEVHGLDIIENCGANAPHRRIKYHRGSIERAPMPADYFDLVFSHATMEHVGDIQAGFAEMHRLTRPGGIVYSLAAPLWQSPYGHHMTCFHGHPWVHLMFDEPGIEAYAAQNSIAGERGHSVAGLVRYMLDGRFFNHLPADAYLAACERLRHLDIISNELHFEDEALLQHPHGSGLLARGYRRDNLLASAHLLVARKRWSSRSVVRHAIRLRRGAWYKVNRGTQCDAPST